MVTSTANTDTATGSANAFYFTPTTIGDYTVGDIVSLTGKLAKGTKVVKKDSTNSRIYVSKRIESTFTGGTVTIAMRYFGKKARYAMRVVKHK